jgi:DNA-binding protein H-NS
MSDTIEAVDFLEAPTGKAVSPTLVAAVSEIPSNDFDVYDAISKRSFTALLSLRDYVNDLLAEKAEAERAALIDKSAELSGYLGLEVAELLTPPKKKSEIKYRDGDGNSWTGKGPKPAWFKAAVDSGVDPETLRV